VYCRHKLYTVDFALAFHVLYASFFNSNVTKRLTRCTERIKLNNEIKCEILICNRLSTVLGSDRWSEFNRGRNCYVQIGDLVQIQDQLYLTLTLPDLNLSIFPPISCLVSGCRSEPIIILKNQITETEIPGVGTIGTCNATKRNTTNTIGTFSTPNPTQCCITPDP